MQGAVVMAFGLGIAYLMYRLTVDDDDGIRVIRASSTEEFP
jgi:cation transporter-like permease